MHWLQLNLLACITLATYRFVFSDKVRFGEVAPAPPQLTAKPRGWKKPRQGTTLLLQDKLKSSKGFSGVPKAARNNVTLGLKRKQDLDEERERAIELYRHCKKAKLTRLKS